MDKIGLYRHWPQQFSKILQSMNNFSNINLFVDLKGDNSLLIKKDFFYQINVSFLFVQTIINANLIILLKSLKIMHSRPKVPCS